MAVKPGTCRVCGCTDDNCTRCVEATGQPCCWVDEDETLCSRCDDEAHWVTDWGVEP